MRLFVAIDTNSIDVEKLQNYLFSKFNFNPHNVKPIKKDNIHITIKFLGEKTEPETKDIVSDLAKIRFDAFKILFNKLGVFPHMRSPRIIWLGFDDQSNKKLNDVYLQINTVLKKYDIGNNRGARNKHSSAIEKFFPHLTIFRIHNNYMLPNFISSLPDGLIPQEEEEVNTISLKKSNITSKGPVYSDLYRIHASKRNAL
jgi:2'-5' RNA ligase